MSANPEVKTKMVPIEYVTLEAPRKTYRHTERVDEAEAIDIPLATLADFLEHCAYGDQFFDSGYIDFGYRAGHAVEAAGWAVRKTRGGYWMTAEFKAWMRERGYEA